MSVENMMRRDACKIRNEELLSGAKKKYCACAQQHKGAF